MLFKQILPSKCFLQNQRIEIWAFPLTVPPSSASDLLNSEEQARAKRFYFLHHQRRFTTGRAMLRLILGHYLDQNAKELRFTYTKHGKPSVENSQNLQFNLSHSKEFALLAVSKKFPLGIDLEFFSLRPYAGIANTLFSSREKQAFFQLPTSFRPLAFFTIWSQKEAFIKACGLGLSYPTQRFDVPVMATTPSLIYDPFHEKSWVISPFMPQLACSAALCHHPDIAEITYIPIQPENIRSQKSLFT